MDKLMHSKLLVGGMLVVILLSGCFQRDDVYSRPAVPMMRPIGEAIDYNAMFLELMLAGKNISVDYNIEVMDSQVADMSIYAKTLAREPGAYNVNGKRYWCERVCTRDSTSDSVLGSYIVQFIEKRMIANVSSYCYRLDQNSAIEIEYCFSPEGAPLQISSSSGGKALTLMVAKKVRIKSTSE